jgi:hypothetical protein
MGIREILTGKPKCDHKWRCVSVARYTVTEAIGFVGPEDVGPRTEACWTCRSCGKRRSETYAGYWRIAVLQESEDKRAA